MIKRRATLAGQLRLLPRSPQKKLRSDSLSFHGAVFAAVSDVSKRPPSIRFYDARAGGFPVHAQSPTQPPKPFNGKGGPPSGRLVLGQSAA